MRRLLLAAFGPLCLCLAAHSQAVIPAKGTPPPIVFVHGNGDDSTRWVPTMWLFESNGYPADRLFAIRFHNPVARTDDTREEPARSSTEDEKAELGRFVGDVLAKTHATKVVLVGSSRGGLTIRNYVQNGEGSRTVLAEILCGTPNHGVNATDTNLNGEFNGKGAFLSALNHPGLDGNEVTPGVRTLTLRSDSLDKYAQPTAIAFGHPEQSSGGSFESPALKGAESIVLKGLDHRELAFSDRAFAEMYHFLLGRAPQTLEIKPDRSPRISGLVTGFAGQAPTNDPLAGVHMRVSESFAAAGSAPVYQAVTTSSGMWGPVPIRPEVGYRFDLEREGRTVTYFLAPLRRSTTLLNFRFVPVPAAAEGEPTLLVTRPDGYFSKERDPVRVAGVVAQQEPSGLPLRDAFTVVVPDGTRPVAVTLRDEQIWAQPPSAPATQLSIVEFLR
ncbi:MAG: twin-arginine translocation pathway signal [Janthinobacterium lividum]